MDGGVYEVDPVGKTATPFPTKHVSYASGCVLTPDGKTLISGGYDGALLWHDVATKQLIRRVEAHRFWSWRLALSPDGQRVASTTGQYIAGGEKYEPAPESESSIKVYNVATGALERSLPHVPPVLSAVFSPDSRRLAAANMMGEIGLWDLQAPANDAPLTWRTADFTSWGTVKSHHYCGGIYALQFSPDGQALLGCGMGPMTDPMAGNGKMTWQRWAWQDSPPRLIDKVRESDGGTGLMEALAFHPDGQSFLMAGRQAQGTWNAALFGAKDGALICSIDAKDRLTQARFSADGRRLFMAGVMGQGQPKDGKWPESGRVGVFEVA
jgi:WD40 repeat protein